MEGDLFELEIKGGTPVFSKSDTKIAKKSLSSIPNHEDAEEESRVRGDEVTGCGSVDKDESGIGIRYVT